MANIVLNARAKRDSRLEMIATALLNGRISIETARTLTDIVRAAYSNAIRSEREYERAESILKALI